MSEIKPEVCIAAIKRCNLNSEFNPNDYETYLSRESNSDPWGFITYPLINQYAPGEYCRKYIAHLTGLEPGEAFAIDVKNEKRDNGFHLVMFYLIAMPFDAGAQVTTPSLELKLENLMELINNSQNENYFLQNHESLLHSVISWIRDHHFDTRIKMEKLFPGPTCEAEPLSVKAVMTNPLAEKGLTPNEDQLMIAIDNPVFEIMMEQQSKLLK